MTAEDPKARIITISVHAILYGVYIATFFHCFRWLLFGDWGRKRRPWEKVNWCMMATNILVLVFSTSNFGLTLRATLGAVTGETLVRDKLDIITVAIENATLLIIDAVMILRCWAIYNKSWYIVCLPLLLWFSDITCAILFLYWNASQVQEGRSLGLLSPYTSIHVRTIFYAFNFASNFYAASAIIYRIVSLARGSGNGPGYLYVILESGIMYSSTSLALLVALLATRSFWSLPVMLLGSINSSTAGIVFNLILIRIGQHRARSLESGVDASCQTNSSYLDSLETEIMTHS